jgi:hypothetical protein
MSNKPVLSCLNCVTPTNLCLSCRGYSLHEFAKIKPAPAADKPKEEPKP